MEPTSAFVAFMVAALLAMATPVVGAQGSQPKATPAASPAGRVAGPASAPAPIAGRGAAAAPAPAPSTGRGAALPPTPAQPAGRASGTAPAATKAPAAPGTAASAAPATALEPQGYTYDPQGRRDPFLSLLRRGSDVQRAAGIRPNGLAGLETSEVTLKGTLASQGTYVGILQGADNKTYIVKAGDKLLDGTIRVINPESMVIAQQVTDPLSLEKQREVRKLLRQTEEGK